jgi:hypothetical protein
VASVQEELAAEEKTLRKLLRWTPRGPRAEVEARLAELDEAAGRVERLRSQIAPPPPPAPPPSEPLPSEQLSALAARREAERERKAKDERRKAQDPARKAIGRIRDFAHAELIGSSLDVSRLSEAEGLELLALTGERFEGELSKRKERRYRALVGTLAGDVDLFERKRKEAEAAGAEARALERARLEAMPLRRYEGKGAAYLPSYLFSWLLRPGSEGLNVTDLGVLAALLFAFEHEQSPFRGSRFEAGSIILAAGDSYQLLPCAAGELSSGATWESVRYLEGNRFLELDTTTDGRTRLRLGERARALLEGTTELGVT